MGKYTDNPARILRTINYLTPHAALMQHFEDYFDLWDSFEDLWRQGRRDGRLDELASLWHPGALVPVEHIRAGGGCGGRRGGELERTSRDGKQHRRRLSF